MLMLNDNNYEINLHLNHEEEEKNCIDLQMYFLCRGTVLLNVKNYMFAQERTLRTDRKQADSFLVIKSCC